MSTDPARDMRLAGRTRLLKLKYLRIWSGVWMLLGLVALFQPISINGLLTPDEFVAGVALSKAALAPMLLLLTIRGVERLDLAFGLLSIGTGATVMTHINNAILGHTGLESLLVAGVYMLVLYLHFTVSREPDPQITVIEAPESPGDD